MTNPGAIVYCGEVVGIWTRKKTGNGVEIEVTLWRDLEERPRIYELSQEYAGFRGERLVGVGWKDDSLR